MKNKKSFNTILAFAFVFFMLSMNTANALPAYATYENVNTNWENIGMVLENGIMILKDQEMQTNMYDYLTPYRGVSLDNKRGVVFECLIDCSEITKYFISNNPANNLVLYTDGNFDFAGTLRPYSVSISLFRENDYLKISYMRNYNGGYNIETKSFPFNGFLSNYKSISFRIELFQAWQSSTDQYFGKINATIKSQADGYEYVIKNDYHSGLCSAGNCFVDLSNSEIRILSTNPSGNWLASNKIITAIRHVYHNNPKSVWLPTLKEIQFENMNAKPLEMEEPSLGSYWIYNSYTLEESTIMPISFQREYSQWNDTLNETETKVFSFDFEFKTLRVNTEERRYYYSTNTIDPQTWGNWEVIIYSGWFGAISYTISFNWFRDLLVMVVNAIIFMFQAIFYLLLIGFNFLLLQPLFWIIVVIWNYPIYWVFVGILAIAFYLSFFFVWLWNQIVVLWKQIIEPLLSWVWNETVAILRFLYNWLFKEGGLQTLVNLYLTLVSYILTAIFFVLSAGLINFTETQQAIAEFLIQLNSVFFQIGSIFISNFPLLIGYSGTYILLVGLVYLKYIYAKSRGYTTRATKLQSMINVYKLPIVLIIRISQYVIGFIQGGVPTDGADQ